MCSVALKSSAQPCIGWGQLEGMVQDWQYAKIQELALLTPELRSAETLLEMRSRTGALSHECA